MRGGGPGESSPSPRVYTGQFMPGTGLLEQKFIKMDLLDHAAHGCTLGFRQELLVDFLLGFRVLHVGQSFPQELALPLYWTINGS